MSQSPPASTSPWLERVSVMFSVATLAVASPVYLTLLERPSLLLALRFAFYLQVVPTAVLTIADLALTRLRKSTTWCARWRAMLYFIALLAFMRQAQAWSGVVPHGLIIVAILLGLVALAALAHRAIGVFLAAFAPALVLWTFYIGYTNVVFDSPSTARGVSAGRSHDNHGPPVFILLFDELDRGILMPFGHVEAEFPNFRRLAEDSVIFTNSTSNYWKTCYSVTSLLTGRLLPRIDLQASDCFQEIGDFRETNLLSGLARRRQVRVYGQFMRYCFDPAFRCGGTADLQVRYPHLSLLRHYLPDEIRRPAGLTAILGYADHTYTLPVFNQFLSEIEPSRAPGTVSYLHVLLPHSPYVFDETGRVHRAPPRGRWKDKSEYVMLLRNYKRQVRFLDRLLGRFIAKLEAAGLYEKSIIVVTSDHGFTSFRDFAPPEVVDGIEINNARPRVPLIVHAPQLRPGVSTTDYQHVDFKGTVLALLGMNGDPGASSAFAPHPARPKVFCDGGVWYMRGADGSWAPKHDEGERIGCGASVLSDSNP